jgi:hypothetical protein
VKTLVVFVAAAVLVCLVCWRPWRGSQIAERVASALGPPPSAVRAGDVFGPLAAVRLPQRPVALPVPPESLDDAYVAEGTNVLFAEAIAMCRHDAEIQANAALMDEYAARYPMKIRPGLVEQGESDD